MTRATRFGHAAHVVGVEVGDEHVVEFGNAGVVHGGKDAIGVAAVVSRPSAINQKGRPRRGDEQRGLAALHIDGVDDEMRGFGLGAGIQRRGAEQQRERAGREDSRGKKPGEMQGKQAIRGIHTVVRGDSHCPESLLDAAHLRKRADAYTEEPAGDTVRDSGVQREIFS